ncbi:DUF3237 domain-containing protein [Streptomyces sp. TRM 70361]|uniref:DUF3237 domain-containing protein n=1 Tax=Streptomyces sp. TRM 70361 TaxID=3116553 RepID=UPI002E7C2BE4|nr:DUF3237 domain-containing protein [Streptomyces sp. TRM 70361]MEE1943197.1 DUF3237 domain-containing protein [Streptomyces sp. TRM 70361]
MADPHPYLGLELLAELHVGTGEPVAAGRVPGGTRTVIPITGGTVGGRIEGTVLPVGADWNLRRADGTGTVSATYPVRTADGTVLTITNRGTVTTRDGVLLGLTAVVVEAPEDSPWAYLNDTPVVGSLALAGSADRPAVHLRFYTVDPV